MRSILKYCIILILLCSVNSSSAYHNMDIIDITGFTIQNRTISRGTSTVSVPVNPSEVNSFNTMLKLSSSGSIDNEYYIINNDFTQKINIKTLSDRQLPLFFHLGFNHLALFSIASNNNSSVFEIAVDQYFVNLYNQSFDIEENQKPDLITIDAKVLRSNPNQTPFNQTTDVVIDTTENSILITFNLPRDFKGWIVDHSQIHDLDTVELKRFSYFSGISYFYLIEQLKNEINIIPISIHLPVIDNIEVIRPTFLSASIYYFTIIGIPVLIICFTYQIMIIKRYRQFSTRNIEGGLI